MSDDQEEIMKALSSRKLNDDEELERSNALSLAHSQAFGLVSNAVTAICAKAQAAGGIVPVVKTRTGVDLPIQGQTRGFRGYEFVVSLPGRPGALIFRSLDAHRINIGESGGDLGHVQFSRASPGEPFTASFRGQGVDGTSFDTAAVDSVFARWLAKR